MPNLGLVMKPIGPGKLKLPAIVWVVGASGAVLGYRMLTGKTGKASSSSGSTGAVSVGPGASGSGSGATASEIGQQFRDALRENRENEVPLKGQDDSEAEARAEWQRGLLAILGDFRKTLTEISTGAKAGGGGAAVGGGGGTEISTGTQRGPNTVVPVPNAPGETRGVSVDAFASQPITVNANPNDNIPDGAKTMTTGEGVTFVPSDWLIAQRKLLGLS